MAAGTVPTEADLDPGTAFGSLSTALAVGFAVWGALIGLRPLSDNSFFTHLATGRLILAEGRVPTVDPYSFTAAGEPWVVQSWLASLLYGLLERAGGGMGIRVGMAVLTGVLGWLVWVLTRPARTVTGRFLTAAIVVGIGSEMWSARPLVLGLVFMSLVLLACQGRLDPRWLLLVMWAWVNCHGSFPLGLVAIGAIALGRRLDGERPELELRCLMFAAAGTIAGAVSPLGPKLLVFPVGLLSRLDVLSKVVEWQSPSFSLAYARLFLLQVAVAVVLLVRRPSYRTAVPLVVFLAAALFGLRNIPVASIVLIPGMVIGFEGVGRVDGRQPSPAGRVGTVAVIIVGMLALAGETAQPSFEFSTFPVGAVRWLDEHSLVARPGVRLAAPDTTGNYLELLYGPEGRVFFDDRVDMFPPAFTERFLTLQHGQPGWEAVLDDCGVNVVLWERARPLAQLLAGSPEWEVRYEDDTWMVATRRGEPAQMSNCSKA